MNDTPTHSLDRLRVALRANATFSIISGATTLVAGSWVSRELGIDHLVLTRMLGAGLLGFAAAAVAIARADASRLLRHSLLVSLADGAWVLATILVVTTGALTPTGNIVAAFIAVAVADFGTAQFWFRARAVDGGAGLRAAGV